MPITNYYYGETGLIMMRGVDKIKEFNTETQRMEFTGHYKVVESFMVKFEHSNTDNRMGRLIGPDGKVMKWLRAQHPDVYIEADTDAIRVLHRDGSVMVTAEGPLAVAKERVSAAVADILPFLNDKDPRNHVLAQFQFYCKDLIKSDFEIEWRLQNFRSCVQGLPKEVSTYYVKGLGNFQNFPPEAYPACIPGFEIGKPLPDATQFLTTAPGPHGPFVPAAAQFPTIVPVAYGPTASFHGVRYFHPRAPYFPHGSPRFGQSYTHGMQWMPANPYGPVRVLFPRFVQSTSYPFRAPMPF